MLSHPDSKIESSTDKFIFRYRQSNVRRLLLGSDYFRALFRCLKCAQRFDYRALGSSRKLGGAGEHLIDGSEKRICRLSFDFSSLHVIESLSKVLQGHKLGYFFAQTKNESSHCCQVR